MEALAEVALRAAEYRATAVAVMLILEVDRTGIININALSYTIIKTTIIKANSRKRRATVNVVTGPSRSFFILHSENLLGKQGNRYLSLLALEPPLNHDLTVRPLVCHPSGRKTDTAIDSTKSQGRRKSLIFQYSSQALLKKCTATCRTLQQR